ncbi:Tetratricopeptide repeat-containing protein [Anaerovibrio lipolyticus DSM 3074]|uniref:Tetratricopeptide repeat-containing protein n=1 Tax=Anaerovibrio lipolyticus DSM 3074 TaxID=1120997 RepID=A0A1M6A0D0_9FIRM|nr:glucosaminidase domain-containing protein [Anaerovibrio lipolyticus]SHI29623.1 Tetratricopeptide repeat-containing protein [Anaerovibrio lipolyticus DSM 3074]
MKHLNYLQYMGRLMLCAAFLLGLAGFTNGCKAQEGQEIHHCITHYRPVSSWEKVADKDKVTILGPAVVNQEQMVQYILSRNPNPKLNCTLEELVAYYYEEAGSEGVRPDVALCQALKETGFFNYGNDVKPMQNNYCGLGALGNKVPGYTFYSPQRGVRAHIQHLLAYATTEMPKKDLVDPRFSVLVEKYPHYRGAAKYWPDLNGRWAVPGTTYGQDILRLWREARQFHEGENDLNKALDVAHRQPNNVEAWERVYSLAYGDGNYEMAILSIDHIIKLDKKNIDAYVKRANIYREWGYNDKALADYNTVLSLDEYNYAALSGRAYLYASIQENRKALADYDALLNRNPGDTVALYNHGCLLADEGHYNEAMEDLAMVLNLDPDNEIAQQAVDDLRAYLKK